MGVKELPAFYQHDEGKLIGEIGRDPLIHLLREMIRIRQFETRAEASYLQGNIGGFFHSYVGQEAIQTGAVAAISEKNWFVTSYRCHALALLLGETQNSLMAELFGKKTGNAKGRGGSMHLYSDRLLGGYGIVGGQIPIATGAALSLQYTKTEDEIAICFFGDGAVPQGAFHESLNMASLMSLPCLYVLENNHWSMGTPLTRTLANHTHFSLDVAKAYGIPHFYLNGMDIFNVFAGFKAAKKLILEEKRPVLIECQVERFKGHSISDPGAYRSKEELSLCTKKDPILFLKERLIAHSFLTDDEYKIIEKQCREEAIQAVQYAEESDFPSIETLELDVFAPENQI